MPNDIFRELGTPITFRDSAGDAVITLLNLAAGAGRISARYDQGAGSKPRIWEWRAVIQWETAPAVGEVAEIYLAESDGTYMDGTLGTADAALGSDKRKNLKLLGVVIADSVSTATDNIASGLCIVNQRYFSIGVWNASVADNLENTANACRVIMTPAYDEVQ
jgi:hypothetical protein